MAARSKRRVAPGRAVPSSQSRPISKVADTLNLLRAYESRNVTFIEKDGSWPIVWTRAKGVNVWDANGGKYLDMTAAFGVAAAGHANPAVVRAGQRQMSKLLHAMGDVHPHPGKAQLARKLSEITFERWSPGAKLGKTIFCNSGFEAVEAALKTALLASGRQGVIAFEGAYHGTGYGSLNVTHRDHFNGPFQSQLRQFGHFLPFPEIGREPDLADLEKAVQKLVRSKRFGAILVEPIQARAGVRIPPKGFLALLRKLCDEFGLCLILDEIYTGFGRTGEWFACEHDAVVPDIICLGKALTGGFPLSACVGEASLIDRAWPPSNGEAIHTSTFLGHPVGCAMALAQIEAIKRAHLVERSRKLGEILSQELARLIDGSPSIRMQFRVKGLMGGLELHEPDGSSATRRSLDAIKTMLRRGYILLPEGADANIISFTPPLTISAAQIRAAVRSLAEVLNA